jgi:hypothetical protein
VFHLLLKVFLLSLLLTHGLLHHLELLLGWQHQVAELSVQGRGLQQVVEREQVLDLHIILSVPTVLL